MTEEKLVGEETGQLLNLKDMVRAYGELASIRMKKTRESVLYNRKFLGQLYEVFEEVRASYFAQVARLVRKRRTDGGDGITFLAHNGRNVAVFFSANSRLYGDLLGEVFELFLRDVRAGSEATVVGKAGLSMFRAVEKGRPVTYFDAPDLGVDEVVLSQLARHLVQYEEVRVFYGKYENEGFPKASGLKLSSKIVERQHEEPETVKFIFEPTLLDILKFFEKEIFGSLLEQSVKESQLAKSASRLIAMNQAEIRINQGLEALMARKLELKHRSSDRKQLGALIGLKGRAI